MNVKQKEAKIRQLSGELDQLDELYPLLGANSTRRKEVLVLQLIDSIRRVEYVYAISNKSFDAAFADPSQRFFDPIKAAVYHRNACNFDEACWLTFLAIHFGKHLGTGWKRVADVYSGLNSSQGVWSWDRISQSPASFSTWLAGNHQGIGGGFGNHRKYESIRPDANRSLSRVFDSYVNWVGRGECHLAILNDELIDKPKEQFDHLYKSMGKVLSFGRTAKFDYLCMLAKLDLFKIEPGKAFLKEATGPLTGSRLLFGGDVKANKSPGELEDILSEMDRMLSLGGMGMQVLEDAICNWQKSPLRYQLFRG